MNPNIDHSTTDKIQVMETTISANRWMGIDDVEHICNGILLKYKTDEVVPPSAKWVTLEDIMLSKRSQAEGQHSMLSLIYGI